MKDIILIEIANKWQKEANEPVTEDGSDEAKEFNAKQAGIRLGKKNCAQQIVDLVLLLGSECG